MVKVGDVIASRLGKTRGCVTVQQDEEFLDGDGVSMEELKKRGLANVDSGNLAAP